MFARILQTSNEFRLTLLRLVLGGVMLPHGLQKTVGAFGGYGFEGTMGYMTDVAKGPGLPYSIALLVVLAESLGSIGLLLGCVTRVCALGIGAVMAGAMWTVHWQNGFFMNWGNNQKGEGFEFHILAIGLAVVLIVGGGGALSIDRKLAK